MAFLQASICFSRTGIREEKRFFEEMLVAHHMRVCMWWITRLLNHGNPSGRQQNPDLKDLMLLEVEKSGYLK